jgi:hypothetical protein
MPFTPGGPPPGRRPRRVDRDQLKHDVLLGLMGGLPLSVVARRNGVSQQTVDAWSRQDPVFAERVAAARALGWDHLAAECLEIADDRSQDVIHDADGTARPNSASVLSRKLMIETRLRLLACWDSGRYGAAKTVRLEGEVTHTQRHVLDPRQMDEAGREALRAVLAHAEAQGLLEAPEPVDDAEYEEGPLDPVEDAGDG